MQKLDTFNSDHMRSWTSVFLLLQEKLEHSIIQLSSHISKGSSHIEFTLVSWKNEHFKHSFVFSGMQNTKYRRKADS